MENSFPMLTNCPLFAGICQRDLESLLPCLQARRVEAQKGKVLLAAGDRPQAVGIVLEGSLHVLQEDYWGNRTILAALQAGDIFGEAFSCAQVEALPVSVIAQEAGGVLLVDCGRILAPCTSACRFHHQLIRNLMRILAGKNILLTQKMGHLTQKTTKEKVLSYLSQCAIEAGSSTFTIPFNRQELADYLSVERSALSNTLGKMRDDSLIGFQKNRFTLRRG